MSAPVLHTDIPGVPRFLTGKVRDVYDLGDALLLVATDRISAFDVVLPTGIPGKGRVLTQMSRFWFEWLAPLTVSHLVSADMDVIGQRLRDAGASAVTPDLVAILEGRSLLVRKCTALPLESVVRGFLSGSAWRDYRSLVPQDGMVSLYGLAVPAGLRESDPFPEPLWTPATKAHTGHDLNISPHQAEELIGPELARAVAERSLALYRAARDYARPRGLLIADTKFEFGLADGQLVLIDEALTPDSSRFWPADDYRPGGPQPSFDKQFVRDYLESLPWDKMAPAPPLPPEIVARTAEKYRDAYRRLTGEDLEP